MRVVVVMGLALGIVELAVRRVDPARLPVTTPTVHLFRKARWLSAHARSEILLFGDSTIHRDVAVRAFEGGAAATALDLGIGSGTPPIIRLLWHEVKMPPKAIVVGMAPLLLSDSWSPEPHELEVADMRELWQLTDGGSAILATTWRTYGWRHELIPALQGWARRQHGDGNARVVYGFTGMLEEDELGALAIDALPLTNTATATRAAEVHQLWSQWLKTAPRAGARAAALRALAAEWQQRHIAVTYVLMPITSVLRRELAASSYGADAIYGIDVLREVSKRFGGTVLDCRDVVDDSAFYDEDHLRVGAARDEFSHALGVQVAGRGGSCAELVHD